MLLLLFSLGIGVTVGFCPSIFTDGLLERLGAVVPPETFGFWLDLGVDSTVLPPELILEELLLEGVVELSPRLDRVVFACSASNTLEGLISVVLPRLS